MKTEVLGRTGLRTSIVGLGAAFIGIPDPRKAVVEYTGPPDLELGIQTVVTVIEAGITLIATAPLYGQTRSEEIIVRTLKGRPDLSTLRELQSEATVRFVGAVANDPPTNAR